MELATLYVDLNRIDEAEGLLFDGLEGAERPPEFARAQSEFYVLKYLRSVRVNGSEAKIELGLLDRALRLDPTNPRVAEEVAGLAAAGVQGAGEDLIASLKEFLASGTATTGTHALLAETYIAKGELAQAIPHLEQVVARVPTSGNYLNNLAYCLAVAQPERLADAVQYSERAIAASQKSNAEFYDTYAMILDLAGQQTQAITAIELAIERQLTAPQLRDRAAEIYRKAGNEEMAQLHEAKSESLRAEIEKAKAAASTPSDTP
jgi:tetratricopeptide (TPR) repeat protein